MATKSLLNLLNSAKYLYLREISEPRDNSLRLIVQEAVNNPVGTVVNLHPELPELAEILKNATPIESTPGCRTFELEWKRYVAYLVTEECVGLCGKYDDESFEGKLFRTYARSHFLQHLERDTGGHIEQVMHYKLICLNHLIDVVAYHPPKIRLIAPEPEAPRIQ